MKNPTNEPNEAVTENLLGVGQRILGNLESIGGVLTGDPATNQEGAFNANVGTLHQESSSVLNENNQPSEHNRINNDPLSERDA